jgi:hypothetical protein
MIKVAGMGPLWFQWDSGLFEADFVGKNRWYSLMFAWIPRYWRYTTGFRFAIDRRSLYIRLWPFSLEVHP